MEQLEDDGEGGQEEEERPHGDTSHTGAEFSSTNPGTWPTACLNSAGREIGSESVTRFKNKFTY